MILDELVRENVKNMKAYSSARDEFSGMEGVFLDANENPNESGINRYPDPYQQELKNIISKIKGVNTKNVLIGNGSDEVLDLLFRAFCEPKVDNIITCTPSYGMYNVLSELNNVENRKIVLKEDFEIDSDEIIGNVDDNTKLIILCSPNNPTGKLIPLKQIELILEKVSCLVVVDEAYIDFSADEGALSLLQKYDNLIISQTLSKYYGMAGLRLGLCFASEEILSVLNRIKPPYNVNTLSQEKAIEVLKQFDSNYKKEVIDERDKMFDELNKLSFVEKVFPSDANFLLAKTKDANLLYDELLKQKIIIRNRTKEMLCENCVRISIGTKEENVKLIKALKDIEDEKSIVY